MADKFLMKGNEALAEAAIRANCIRFFGYPITPQTELAAYMAKKLPKIDGGVYMQAESEVAAINMVLGAASAGVRAMTSSSSPGVSLKSEGVSYIAGSDLPCLIINVQRAGPGLGGIQPAQGDYWQATKALGHGDFQLLVFAPSSIQEMVDMVFDAFELAEKYRMPAMILSDGLLGQMMEPVAFPDRAPKMIEKPWATTGHQGRRPHNITNSLYLDPAKLEASIDARYERYKDVIAHEQRHVDYRMDDAQFAVVAYGSMARVCGSAVDMAREDGIAVGLIRPVTLWPFPKDALRAHADKVRAMLTVEMSMGQMVDDVRLAVEGKCPVSFYGRVGGVIPTPREVYEQIKKLAGGKQ
ncbi:MAG: 3-methyl-2-oxobutanoate dehydrogenase subunit VorB [Oscillospiraceae bacterium]|nr:3-methyl-2-oxobutanoate dehydrogenase subunit VorB [Oscillospiraceae bacterium]